MSDPRPAVIMTKGWAGYREQPVLVIGETPKRYRIRATQQTKLAGRCRWIEAGQEVLVPKRAVKFTPDVTRSES